MTPRGCAARLVAPVLLVGAWALAAHAGWPSPRAVPSPGEVLALAARELGTERAWLDLTATLTRVLVGVAIATAIGGSVGIVLGAARGAWHAAEPTVELLRAIPPILTFPLFLLALGYGEHSRLAAIVFGTTGIVLFHVATGLARAPRERAEAVRLAGLRGWDAFAQLHLHEAMPALVTGVRVALPAGLVIAVVTEMLIGARYGLGARALDAQLAYRADTLWFVILLGGIAGMSLSALVGALGRYLVRWGGTP